MLDSTTETFVGLPTPSAPVVVLKPLYQLTLTTTSPNTNDLIKLSIMSLNVV